MPDWPFTPRGPVRETLEFSTDVLTTEAGEQRLALRTLPREILALEHRLDQAEAARLQALVRASFSHTWTVPLWSRLERAAPPTRVGRITQAIELSRARRGLTRAEVTFTLDPDPAPPAAPAYPVHEGREVLTDPTVARGPVQATLAETVEYVDNGFGPIAIEPLRTVFDHRSEIVFQDFGATQRRDRRGWLTALRGRQRAFWLPSGMGELVPLESAGAGATTMLVGTTEDPARLVGQAILIDTDMPQPRTIGAAVAEGAGVRITLPALTAPVTPATLVHRLHLVRLDTDRVELLHTPVATRGRVAVREVPS